MAQDYAGQYYRFMAEKIHAGAVALSAEEAHHAIHVLRLESGTPVEIFDGRGHHAVGTLQRQGKKAATVIVSAVEMTDPPTPRLTIATAVPKGERALWLIDQCSQLAAARVQWLTCDRGIVRPSEEGGKMAKFRRQAVESAKQCGRNWLLEVMAPQGIAQTLEQAQAAGERVLWLVTQSGAAVRAVVSADCRAATALIGPEGGWSGAEIALLDAAAADGVVTRVTLTPTVLRIETACAALAAIVMSR